MEAGILNTWLCRRFQVGRIVVQKLLFLCRLDQSCLERRSLWCWISREWHYQKTRYSWYLSLFMEKQRGRRRWYVDFGSFLSTRTERYNFRTVLGCGDRSYCNRVIILGHSLLILHDESAFEKKTVGKAYNKYIFSIFFGPKTLVSKCLHKPFISVDWLDYSQRVSPTYQIQNIQDIIQMRTILGS